MTTLQFSVAWPHLHLTLGFFLLKREADLPVLTVILYISSYSEDMTRTLVELSINGEFILDSLRYAYHHKLKPRVCRVELGEARTNESKSSIKWV